MSYVLYIRVKQNIYSNMHLGVAVNGAAILVLYKYLFVKFTTLRLLCPFLYIAWADEYIIWLFKYR